MRHASLLIPAVALSLVAGSAIAARGETPRATAAQAELRAAKAEVARLRAEAEAARSDAAQLAAEREAAAAEIDAAEAEISIAEESLRERIARYREAKRRLDEQRAPAASLVAGLVNMSRTPPIVAAADVGGLNELVRIRGLLATTLPHLREQSRELSDDLALARDAAREAIAARNRLGDARERLALRQADFLALERQVLERAGEIDREAVGAGDRLILATEQVASAQGTARQSARARSLATRLANVPAPPDIGGPAPGRLTPFDYRLPADAKVIEGLGAIGNGGIRSRGVRFATSRGDLVRAPARGTIVFAGPYRRHDGVVIIDHGDGWYSMLIDVAPDLKRGVAIGVGEPIGRALGPIRVELSRDGRHHSPAVAAARSLAIKARRS